MYNMYSNLRVIQSVVKQKSGEKELFHQLFPIISTDQQFIILKIHANEGSVKPTVFFSCVAVYIM